MRHIFVVFLLFIGVTLFAHPFDGEWRAKFELSERHDRYTEEALFYDATINVEEDIAIIGNREYEFRITNDLIVFNGNLYSYSTRDNMIILYPEGKYSFNRILFIRPFR